MAKRAQNRRTVQHALFTKISNAHGRALADHVRPPCAARVKLSGLRAITFDAAGTLIVPHPSVGAVYGEIGRAHDLPVTDAEREQRFHAAFRARHHRPRPTEAAEVDFWRDLVGEVFAPWAGASAINRLFPDLWDAFAQAHRWRPRADMAAIFATLRARGLKLAILSNWDSRLHRVVDGHDWRRWLDHVFVSADLGVEKPDAQSSPTPRPRSVVPPRRFCTSATVGRTTSSAHWPPAGTPRG